MESDLRKTMLWHLVVCCVNVFHIILGLQQVLVSSLAYLLCPIPTSVLFVSIREQYFSGYISCYVFHAYGVPLSFQLPVRHVVQVHIIWLF